jgi:raffinose/stachyose/melibiose transport system permease protein
MSALSARVGRPRFTVGRTLLWLGVAIAAVVWATPFVFMIFTSLKTEAEIFSSVAVGLPAELHWANYSSAWSRGGLATSGFNSLVISVIKVPLGLLVSALAAFALARLRFKRQLLLLAIIAMGAMIPPQVALAPLFRIVLNLGLLNTHLGVILPYIAWGLPYQIFILYGFFKVMPRELDEAALIDGASKLQLFWRITLPLAKPALAALFILDFVATWNEYPIALVILQNQSSWTVPLAIQQFNTQWTSMYGPLNAFIALSILPVLIVYLRFQKYFTRGLFAGAVKG